MSESTASRLLVEVAPQITELAETARRVQDAAEEPEEAREAAEVTLAAIAQNLSVVTRQLTGRGRTTLAQQCLIGLASVSDETVAAAVDELLADLGPLDQLDLNVAVARGLRFQPISGVAGRLRAIDPALVGSQAREELGELSAELWRVGIADGAEIDWDNVTEPLAALSELVTGGADIDDAELLEAIGQTLAGPVASSGGAENSEWQIELLDAFVDAGVIPEEGAAAVLTSNVSATLEAAPSPGHEDSVAGYVIRVLRRTALNGDDEQLESVDSLVPQAPWLRSPYRETASLEIASALERPTPLSSSAIADLAERFEAEFADGHRIWIERFAEDPGDVAETLVPYFPGPLPKVLAEGLSAYGAGLSKKRRARLSLGAIRTAFEHEPQKALLRQLQIDRADEGLICQAIVALFEEATNNDEREQVLKIWDAFEPKKREVRKTLFFEVLVPIARANATAYDLAGRYARLCTSPPPKTKDDLVKSLLDAAPSKDRRKQMQQRLRDAGLLREGLLSKLGF